MKEYSVYKHTSPKGKVYIGLTKRKPEIRWSNGNGYERQVFHQAITKYGWENIESEVLHQGLSKAEACRIEMELISEYKSNDNRYGYNISSGGELGTSHTNETIEKILITKINDGTVTMTWDKADEVRKIFGADETKGLEEIASSYGVSRHTIKRILLNEAWRNDSYQVVYRSKELITKKDVDYIRLSYNNKEHTQEQLAEMYNYSTGGIHLIVTNQVWRDEDYETEREHNYAHKMNWDTVKELRELGKGNRYTQKDLAIMFGVDRATVCNILNNTTWVDDKYVNDRCNPTRKLNIEIAREIRELYKNSSVTQRELSLQYGVGKSTIHSIVNNQTWVED